MTSVANQASAAVLLVLLLQLEREATLREASLASASQEIASLQDERRGQAAAMQQQALELAAYERQVCLD